MSTEKKKMSTAKFVALVISIGLHAILFFYLGRIALDKMLPQGDVSSIEMNFEASKGNQAQATPVDVLQPPPTETRPTETVALPNVKPKPTAKKPPTPPPTNLPPKDSVVEDQQGTLPVATQVQETPPEDVTPEETPTEETPSEPETTSVPEQPAALETTQEVPAAAPTPEATATDLGYGTPVGEQMEALVPYGTNRSHTYPYMARLRKAEGVAVVQYTVGTDGTVTDAKITESSGHSILDKEAVGTIKTWRFKPMKSEVVYEKHVRFQLRGEAKAAPSQLRRMNK